MMLRATGAEWKGRLWLTESRDSGVHWTFRGELSFSDNDSKFHFGKLPGKRFYYAGIPDAMHHYARIPLVVSVSNNGVFLINTTLSQTIYID